MKFSLVTLSLALLFTTQTSFADPTPDEIDFNKYLTIYQQFKAVSDQKRSDANQAQAAANTTRDQIIQITNKLNQNSTTISNHQRELVQLAQDIQNLREQLILNTNRIDQNQNEINQNLRLLQNLQIELTQVTYNRDQAQRNLDQANAAYPSALRSKQNAESTLAAATRDRSTAQTQLSQAQSALAAKQHEAATLQNSIRDLNNERATLTRAIPELQKQVQALEAQIKVAEQNHDAAQVLSLQKQRDRINHAITQNQARLTQIQSSLTTQQNSLNQLASPIIQLQRQVDAALANFNTKDQVFRSATTQLQQAQTGLVNAQRQAQSCSIALNNLQEKKQNLETTIYNGKQQNQIIQAECENLIAQNQNIRSSTRAKQDQIDWLNQDIPYLQRQNQDLARQQDTLNPQLATQQNTFSQLNQVATQAESLTQLKFNDYDIRKKLYDSRLADATQAGQIAGSQLGQTDGASNGTRAGNSQGTQDGKTKGTQDGLTYGLDQGKKAGDAKGYHDGHTQGVASTTDYQKGSTDGFALGTAEANAEANQIDYVNGKKDQYTKLTSIAPTQITEIDQGSKILKYFLKSNFKPKPAASRIADCLQSYIDFKTACENAYKEAYDRSSQESYQTAYDDVYSLAFEQARKIAYDQNTSVRYQEGYDLAYSPAFQRGLAIGHQEAYQRGVVDGRKLGYDQNISQLRTQAYTKGVTEMNQYFATHSVLKVQSAKLIRYGLDQSVGGDVGASDTLKLQLKVANFGSKNSDPQKVKVEVQALTSQLLVSQNVIQLTSIPGNTLATVSSVLSIKVLETATQGSTEQLKVKFTDEEGNVSEQVLSVQVRPNLQVSITRVDYSTSPRVGRTQYIKVFLNNFGNIEPSEKVNIAISTDAPASVIRIEQNEQEVFELPTGSTYSIQGLAYTVLSKEALDQGISLTVFVKHGSRVVAKQKISLKN